MQFVSIFVRNTPNTIRVKEGQLGFNFANGTSQDFSRERFIT